MSTSNNWFRCNKCHVLAGNNTRGYSFTSCGHVICPKCYKSEDVVIINSGRKEMCIVCKKQNVSRIPLDKNTRSDILQLFRSPQDLITEYANKTKKVIGFQQHQCQQRVKYLEAKCDRAVKFAQNIHGESSRRANREQSLIAERNQLKGELTKMKEYASHLENVVVDRDKEIERLKHHNQSSRRATSTSYTTRKGPSLNGPTPLHSLSFYEVMTSTPQELEQRASRRADMNPEGKEGSFNFFSTPYQAQREKSPVMAAAPDFQINTPLLLGFSREQDGTPDPTKYF